MPLRKAEELAVDVEAKIVAASDLKAEAEEAVEEAGALAVAAEMESEAAAEDAALSLPWSRQSRRSRQIACRPDRGFRRGSLRGNQAEP